MRLRPAIKKYQEAGISEKSHKEGPIADGRMPYELPACGGMPYELPTCTEERSVIKKKLCETKKQQGVRSSYERRNAVHPLYSGCGRAYFKIRWRDQPRGGYDDPYVSCIRVSSSGRFYDHIIDCGDGVYKEWRNPDADVTCVRL